MVKATQHSKDETAFGYYFWIFSVLWTLLAAFSLSWSLAEKQEWVEEAARIQAKTAVEKDIVYRRWNARLGGVYGPVDENTPPNPYLDTSGRDISIPGGTLLTKINPAYMTRQVHELGALKNGVLGHITSLKPLRPKNKPDPWETNALKLIAKGRAEVSQVAQMNGADYLRLMTPLYVEQSCLPCHHKQGYKLNQLRGGISVSVPLAPIMAGAHRDRLILIVVHMLLWLLGTGFLIQMFRQHNLRITARRRVEQARIEKEKLTAVMETAGAACHQLNQPLQVIMGQVDLLLMELKNDKPSRKRVDIISNELMRLQAITNSLTHITRYETMDYPDGSKILDLDRSIDSTQERPGNQSQSKTCT